MSEFLDACAVEAAFGGAGQEVAQFLGEAAGLEGFAQVLRPVEGAVLRFAVEEAPDFQELFGAGEEAGRLPPDSTASRRSRA